MGKCAATFREIRFVLEDELTQVFVAIEAVGDCPISVQGWHHKTFPASLSAIDILNRIGSGDDPVLWDGGAPG